MKKNIITRMLTSVGVLVMLFALTPSTFAIGISPVRHEFDLAPGESDTATLTINNESGTEIAVDISIKAFIKQDDSGYPVPLDLEDTASIDIRKWIKLPELPIIVPGNESIDISYTITVPHNAEPGGKYAAIAFEPIVESESSVKVKTRLNTLALINVAGDVIRTGEVLDFSIPNEIKSDMPFLFNINFNNTGNTHIKPMGYIEIIDLSTNEPVTGVSLQFSDETKLEVVGDTIPINFIGGNVLPNNSRIFENEWMQNIYMGDFRANMKLNYEEGGEAIEDSIEFSIKQDIAVESFDIEINESEADFVLNVKNNGNIYEKLTGKILITNSFGYNVDEILLPEVEDDYIAPGESREITLKWLDKDIPVGRYKAKLEAKYGLTDETLTSEIKFGEFDKVKIGLSVAVVILILTTIFALFRKRR